MPLPQSQLLTSSYSIKDSVPLLLRVKSVTANCVYRKWTRKHEMNETNGKGGSESELRDEVKKKKQKKKQRSKRFEGEGGGDGGRLSSKGTFYPRGFVLSLSRAFIFNAGRCLSSTLSPGDSLPGTSSISLESPVSFHREVNLSLALPPLPSSLHLLKGVPAMFLPLERHVISRGVKVLEDHGHPLE